MYVQPLAPTTGYLSSIQVQLSYLGLLHLLTMLLLYAYIKQELTFNVIWILIPSLIVIVTELLYLIKVSIGVCRMKYIIISNLLLIFLLVFSKAIKNNGGQKQQNRWILKHNRCIQLIGIILCVYIIYTLIDKRRENRQSLFHKMLMSILSSLSIPIGICSGGVCTSIYLSTITSILSAFSVPLTLAIPILNAIGYIMQIVGLVSIYSVNKWKSLPFWLYLLGSCIQFSYSITLGCIINIISVIINAKYHKFQFKSQYKFNSII